MRQLGETIAYVGAMGSGKTSLLCKNYRKAKEDKLTVMAFKPSLDDRLGMDSLIVARNKDSVPCKAIEFIGDILDMDLYGVDKVFVDEVQFFDSIDDVESLFDLNMKGIDVEVYGLDMNATSDDFGVMGLLLARADVVYKVSGTCSKCEKHPARFTAFMGDTQEDEIQVGDIGDYLPMCKICYKEHMVNKFSMTIYDQLFEGRTVVPHPYLDNVKVIDGDTYHIILGGTDFDFTYELFITESVLHEAGWTVEDASDIIDKQTALRLLEEMGMLDSEQ